MAIIIQPLIMSDWPWCKDIAMEEANQFDYLRADEDKMKVLFTDGVSSARSFAVKAVNDDQPVGMMLALSAPNLWAGKQCSNVLIWVSRLAPAGALLIREYKKWLEGRPAIRVSGFTPCIDLPEQTNRLMEHFGFARTSGCFLSVK